MPYKSIIVGVSCEGNESLVVQEAFKLKEQLGASLTFIHINRTHAGEMSMMMDSPGRRYDEEEVREIISNYGFQTVDFNIEIDTAEYVQRALTKHSKHADLLILGHRRMSSFKEKFFDSIDEGIVNNVKCPVLVVPKPE